MNFNIANLYPKVQFPVSATTPMISPYIKWVHDDDWFVTCHINTHLHDRDHNKIVKVNLKNNEFQYLEGHCIDGKFSFQYNHNSIEYLCFSNTLLQYLPFLGRILFPATGYLYLIWDLLATKTQSNKSEFPVEFQDVKFLRATGLSQNTDIVFNISFQRDTGHFEIVEGSSAVVTGRIKILEDSLADLYQNHQKMIYQTSRLGIFTKNCD